VRVRLLAALLLVPTLALAQGHKFPPDSLVNTKVFPHNTPVQQVIGQMRDITGALGVRCQFCHVGQEGQPLDQFDFTKDDKDTKLIARQMMRMVAEINRRLDTLPGRAAGDPVVTCRTCHRGVQEPIPLSTIVLNADSAAGADSAARAYRNLRTQYYGRDAYDFGEGSLNMIAFRLARAGKLDDALALLALNESFYPTSSMTASARGNVQLMKGDTNAAATSFRQAIQRDSTNRDARRSLQQIGRQP